MLGNESNASRRSRGADSGAPPPAELLEFGPGTAGSRKRRLEEEEGADAESLNRAIASVKAVTEDLCAHARAAGGLVSFAGTPDLLGQLDRGVEQVAVLWRPTKENEIKLDEIDALGSTIWNLSINTKKDNGPPGKTAGRTIVADLRSCAYKIIELCETKKDDVNALLKLVMLGTKVGKAFYNNGDHKRAADAFQKAHMTHERLCSLSTSNGKTKSMANIYQPFMSLCLHRAELAFEQGNLHNAHHLVSRALERNVMVHASPSFIQTLLETELEFSKKQIARGEFLDAAKWARKAIDLLDSDGESEQKKLAPTIAAPLRQAVLKTLATAYIYSEVPANLELAGNAIELAQEADPDDAGLYFLQQKKLLLEGAADETRMLQLCDMSVQKANLSNEGSVSILASMLHNCTDLCGKRRMLLALRQLIQRVRSSGHSAWVERLLCAVCNLLTTGSGSQIGAEESCQLLEDIYGGEIAAGLKPSPTTVSSCQLMLWRAADELFAAGEFRDSLTLFETSKRIQFGAIDLQNQQILTRRIADCQLKLGNAAAARNAIIAALEATSRHPSSLRLLFEADLQQGKLDECRNVIAEIAASADTAETVSALGHVASIASQHISGADLVSAAIQSLIQVHRDRSLPISSKFLPLYRKLIKINQDSSANEEAAAMINADLFGEVAAICADNDLQPTEEEQLEVLLLAKWAWNAAVALQGADTDIVARAFDIASTLLERARAMAPVSDAKDFWQRSLASIVATAAACVRHARVTSDEASRKDALEAALDRVQKFKEAAAQSPFRDVSPAEDALGSQLLLIEFEARLALFQYAELQVFLTSIGEDVHWTTLELMTDLALRSDKTPSGIQFLVIQVTLDAILRQDEIDSSKFATWMRVLIITACNKNHASALQFFDQILEIMDETYPETEVEWLVSKAWNIGVEAMAVGDHQKAKAWCETAMKFLPRLTSTKGQYEPTMTETYAQILEMTSAMENAV